MKKLFIILKATTGVTLIAPTILTLTSDLQQNENSNSDVLDKIVTANQNFMKNQLLDHGTSRNESFDNYFKNPQNNKIIPIGNFRNDNSNGDWYKPSGASWYTHKIGTNDGNGAPYVRYGGGLYLDNKNYSVQGKSKLGNNLFSTSNFVSTNSQKPTDVPANLPPLANNNRNASDISPQTSWGNLDTKTIGGDYKQTTQYYQTESSDFSKTQAKTDPNDHIVNGGDLNYTPDYVPGTEKTTSTGTTGKKSDAKSFFTKLFNIELFDWYWKTWGPLYVQDPSIAQQNIDLATKRETNLNHSRISDAPKLNLSTSFNKLVSKTVSNPWYDKMAGAGGSAVTGLLVDALFNTLDEEIPGIGALAGFGVDMLMPDNYTIFQSIKQLLTYQSVALDQPFWENFFDQALGTPDSKSGLIYEYQQQYKELPSVVDLKNFDIYSPFNGLNIKSQFDYDYWKGDYSPSKTDLCANDSNSTIDLSKLNVNLGAEFRLSNNGSSPSVNKLINKLKNDKTIYKLLKNGLNPPYTASNNSGYIKDKLSDAGYSSIAADLSFTGQIKMNGTVSKINWFYNGTLEGQINVETF